MKIIKTVEQLQLYRATLQQQRIGFVATMGALHAGHLSMVKQCHEDNQISVVSIFINPTQFDNKDDLDNYPNLIENDLIKLEQTGVDCVFLPNMDQIYPDKYRFSVKENELSTKFCGAHREGHFDGVLTVVMKLLNLIQPDFAYFGEKDYQQLTLIRQMVAAFFMSVKIIASKTIREKDGLAMSSRNLNLTDKERNSAPLLYQTINSTMTLEHMHKQLIKKGFKIDYLEVLGDRLLVAAYLGKVRLIDNVKINKLEKTA